MRRGILALVLLGASLAPAAGRAMPPAGRATPPAVDASWWQPAQGASWQYQLTNAVDYSVDAEVFDIEMFENDASVVAALHARGRRVVCYISAGSWEDWRPDRNQFPAYVKGKPLEGWPGEWWLDIRRIDVLGPIMEARLDECKAKGFDAVEFDNVDAYTSDTGFDLTAEHQLTYNRFLAAEAHERGLGAALKNDVGQAADLVGNFDFAIDEGCFSYDECEMLAPFIDAGKAVLHVEYDMLRIQFCPQARRMGFSSIKKRLELDAWRKVCGELGQLLPQ